VLEKPLFRNRVEAGRILARQVKPLVQSQDVIVLALPRGGVPVAFEVVQALKADLDIFLVRKLGVPGHEELALGAVTGSGVRVLNRDLVEKLGIPAAVIDSITEREREEIARRERVYREGRPALPVRGRTAVLVDDGLATGATMLAAAKALRAERPARIIVAVPVAAPETCREFGEHVDEVVCAATPEPFYAVGAWYEDFAQTSDEEVRQLLERAAREHVA
jgi:predicted phosphoribosyltransferase